MDYFTYEEGKAKAEQVDLEILAETYGTPLFVYSQATLSRHLESLKAAFQDYPTLLCYATKANSNLSLLKIVAQHGYGADLVSQGELERGLKSGIAPSKMVFSGVGKTSQEISRALEAGILAFNVESAFELNMIQEIASSMDKVAPINLRVNPNITADTNPKISTGSYSTKFGIPETELAGLVETIKSSEFLKLTGLACHIGSQMTDLGPLSAAAERVAGIAKEFINNGHQLELIDMGGGLGIRYDSESPPSLSQYADTLISAIKPTGLKLVIEPGRVVMGNVGILLTKVIGIKTTPEKNFIVVDGAINDFIRPAMYDSYHQIVAVGDAATPIANADIVGPICETGDIFGKDRTIDGVQPGSLVYIRSVGAYGSVMSSNYNSRPRSAEVLVNGDQHRLIRKRESYQDLWQLEEL